MKISIENKIYEGSAQEIMETLRDQAFDPREFPTVDSYILFLQNNFIRMTDQECPLPEGDTEQRALAMFCALSNVGCLTLVED